MELYFLYELGSTRVHEGERGRTSASKDLDIVVVIVVFIFIIFIIIIFFSPLLERLHLSRGGFTGGVDSACRDIV